MKKFFYLIWISVAMAPAWAQHITSNTPDPVLFQKSKTQQVTGFVLLGAGLTTTIVGLSIATSKLLENVVNGKKTTKGEDAVIAGVTMMAGSIPFFIMAEKTLRASLTLSNFTKCFTDGKQLFTFRPTPQLTLTLSHQLF